ncbi:hexokinase-1-like [Sarcoptes scabiei]|nr:hexokinase-1-like [Sarcoptes scabiei]
MTIHNFSENPSILQRNSIEEISFTALGLDNDLIASIKDIIGNNSKPSNIQHAVIPKILQFKNVIFSAETGSGKTIAYLAPLIQIIHQSKQLDRNQNRNPKLPYALIILPFRELTEQIGKIAKILARKKDVGVATMIGGLPKHIPQTGMDLIITTIGMIDSHLNNGIYSLRKLDHLVLDESDTLFDDSFLFETMDLIEKLNLNHSQNLVEDDNAIDVPHKLNGTQLICSSATMPQSLDSSIGNVIDMEEDVDQISTKSLHSLHSNIKHIFYRVNRHEKIRKLLELMFEARSNGHPTIIFTNRIDAVNWLYHFLNEKDFPCVRLTKEMDEEERFHSYNSFENGEFNILVATDLGSRGLDTINVCVCLND